MPPHHLPHAQSHSHSPIHSQSSVNPLQPSCGSLEAAPAHARSQATRHAHRRQAGGGSRGLTSMKSSTVPLLASSSCAGALELPADSSAMPSCGSLITSMDMGVLTVTGAAWVPGRNPVGCMPDQRADFISERCRRRSVGRACACRGPAVGRNAAAASQRPRPEAAPTCPEHLRTKERARGPRSMQCGARRHQRPVSVARGRQHSCTRPRTDHQVPPTGEGESGAPCCSRSGLLPTSLRSSSCRTDGGNVTSSPACRFTIAETSGPESNAQIEMSLDRTVALA